MFCDDKTHITNLQRQEMLVVFVLAVQGGLCLRNRSLLQPNYN